MAIRQKRTRVQEACRRAGFEPSVSIFTDNILSCITWRDKPVRGHLDAALAKRLSRPNLRAIPFDDPCFDWSIYLIKLKNAKLSPEAKAFESLLLQYRKERTATEFQR
jgi:hypothetical protein